MSRVFAPVSASVEDAGGFGGTDELVRAYLEPLCNVYFFSGVVFPASNPKIAYRFDVKSGTWQVRPGSGPRFSVTSVSIFEGTTATFEPVPPANSFDDDNSALHLFVTPANGGEADLTLESCIDVLAPDSWKFLRVQQESRGLVNGTTRFLPLASSDVFVQDLGRGESTSESATTHFTIHQLNFGFSTLVSEALSMNPAVDVSSFVADVFNVLEIVLGLSLFSLLLRTLSFPVERRNR